MRKTCATLAIAIFGFGWTASHAQSGAPRYEVDRSWPKPLPERWVLGGLGGLCVDRQDHVLILTRQDVLDGGLYAGQPAAPLIELDAAGYAVRSCGEATLPA